MNKLISKKVFLRIIFLVVLLVLFWLGSTSSALATCDDSACRTMSGSLACSSNGAGPDCRGPTTGGGGNYMGSALVSMQDCINAFGSCPGDKPYCRWYTWWTAACGQCWCSGSAGGTDYNGVVLAEDTGGTTYVKPVVQVSPSSGTRKWQVGHFDIKDADAGSNSITLSQLAPGYDDCSWSIWNYSTGAPTGESGDTCTATFDLPSSDWKRRVDFTMYPCPATQAPPTNVECVLNASQTQGTLSWDYPSGNILDYPLRIRQNSARYIYEPEDNGMVTSSPYTFSTTPGNTYDGWMHARDTCGTWSDAVGFTCKAPATIQGRVSMDADRDHYFSPNCSGCTGICDDVPGLNITCTKDSDTFNTSWGCNPRAAYGTGRVFTRGDTVSCDISFPSTDYELVGWYLDNLAPTVNGTCSNPGFCTASGLVLDQGNDGWGDNNLWFLVDPTLRGPWWQVIDGDVATNGSLTSLIPLLTCESPCEPFFDLPPLDGGYPGIPSYMGEADFAEGVGDPGTVSETGWLAESRTILSRVYDYGYFEGMIPPDVDVHEILDSEISGGYLVSKGNDSHGYFWFKKEGDLTIKGVANLGNRKVILLVNGTLSFGENPTAGIRLDDGKGFFAAIARDDILISPKVKIDPSDPKPVLEGIFLAGREFKTGTTGTQEDGQLWLRGSVAADVIVLQRDMMNVVPPAPNNDEDPAERFEYAPDLLLTFPRELTSRRLRWKEVAP